MLQQCPHHCGTGTTWSAGEPVTKPPMAHPHRGSTEANIPSFMGQSCGKEASPLALGAVPLPALPSQQQQQQPGQAGSAGAQPGSSEPALPRGQQSRRRSVGWDQLFPPRSKPDVCAELSAAGWLRATPQPQRREGQEGAGFRQQQQLSGCGAVPRTSRAPGGGEGRQELSSQSRRRARSHSPYLVLGSDSGSLPGSSWWWWSS